MKQQSENSTLAKRDLISLRPYNPIIDDPFIYATWLKGLRYGNALYELIDQDAYFMNYHRVVEAILKRPQVEISVACLKNDPEVILGYAVAEEQTLHWIFVKTAWRKIGIANDLLCRLYEQGFERVTHVTDIGKSILFEKFPTVKFNPFL